MERLLAVRAMFFERLQRWDVIMLPAFEFFLLIQTYFAMQIERGFSDSVRKCRSHFFFGDVEIRKKILNVIEFF